MWVVLQWQQVESYLASEYHMDTAQVLRETSWRRLKVLLAAGFHPATSEQGKIAELSNGRGGDPRYAKYGGFDWNAALDKAIGRPPPEKVVRMSLDDFMKTM